MKTMTRLFAAFAALAITFGSVAASPTSESKSQSFQIRGRVLQIDEKARTVLVADHWSKKLYLVTVPEGAYFKVTFGRAMGLSYPEISDLSRERHSADACQSPNGEKLTLLQDGREAVVLIASR